MFKSCQQSDCSSLKRTRPVFMLALSMITIEIIGEAEREINNSLRRSGLEPNQQNFNDYIAEAIVTRRWAFELASAGLLWVKSEKGPTLRQVVVAEK